MAGYCLDSHSITILRFSFFLLLFLCINTSIVWGNLRVLRWISNNLGVVLLLDFIDLCIASIVSQDMLLRTEEVNNM